MDPTAAVPYPTAGGSSSNSNAIPGAAPAPKSTGTRALLALLLRRRIGSQREDKDFDNIIRLKTLQIAGFSGFGIVAMLFVSFFCWISYSNKKNTDAYYDDPDLPVKLLTVLYMGQAAMTSSTIVTILLIAQKYRLLLVQRRAEWSGTDIFEIEGFRGVAARDSRQRDYFLSSYNFWKSPLAKQLAAEVLVHAIHPFVWMASAKDLPTVPASYDYSTVNLAYKVFQLAMFFRLYLVLQLVEVLNPGYRNRFEIVNNDVELSSVGYHIDASLTLKLMVHKHPLSFFLSVSTVSLIAFGFGVFSVERVEGPVGPLVRYILPEDAFWWAYATMRGIGYGEFSPRTLLGRFVAASCVICGIMTTAVFSGVLVTKIQLQKELKQALEFLHTTDAHVHMQNSAASLLATAWRLKKFREQRKQREADNRAKRDMFNALHEEGENNNDESSEDGDPPAAAGAGGAVGSSGEARRKKNEENELRTNLLLPGEDGKSGSGTTAIQFEFEPGHKADLLYFGIKHFRNARKRLNAAMTQSEDVVMNQKVESVLALTQALRKELDHHQKDFESVEKMISSSFDAVAKDISRYRKMGHVPV